MAPAYINVLNVYAVSRALDTVNMKYLTHLYPLR